MKEANQKIVRYRPINPSTTDVDALKLLWRDVSEAERVGIPPLTVPLRVCQETSASTPTRNLSPTESEDGNDEQDLDNLHTPYQTYTTKLNLHGSIFKKVQERGWPLSSCIAAAYLTWSVLSAEQRAAWHVLRPADVHDSM